MKIYLAGPDVFRKDAIEHGERLKALCAKYGHEGLYPMDNKLPEGLSPTVSARWIYDADLDQLNRADVVIANISPFRGPSCDVGTAVEIGYAVAQGKFVYTYTEDMAAYDVKVKEQKINDGMLVEGFGLTDNLMISCSARYVLTSFEECLIQLNKDIEAGYYVD